MEMRPVVLGTLGEFRSDHVEQTCVRYELCVHHHQTNRDLSLSAKLHPNLGCKSVRLRARKCGYELLYQVDALE